MDNIKQLEEELFKLLEDLPDKNTTGDNSAKEYKEVISKIKGVQDKLYNFFYQAIDNLSEEELRSNKSKFVALYEMIDYSQFVINWYRSKILKSISSSIDTMKLEKPFIIFFYTDWCPHCVKAKPEWQKFKKYLKEKGYPYKPVSVNGDKYKKITGFCEIRGYPTVLKVENEVMEDLNNTVTFQNLKDFIK